METVTINTTAEHVELEAAARALFYASELEVAWALQPPQTHETYRTRARAVLAAVPNRPGGESGALAALRSLSFRPERSRPVYRNKHTGAEVTVLDLGVDDRGGFQGGCRQHTVLTDEPGPPGYRGARNPMPLWSFLEHWESTGRWVASPGKEGAR